MAKLLVRPHDLQQACAVCGITLETLAAETGLAGDVLLAFAAGRIALSAADRLAILGVLVRHAPPATLNDSAEMSLEERNRIVNAAWQQQCNRHALARLTHELESELALRESRVALEEKENHDAT